MSQLCPLCGNIKNTDSLFCANCKTKIEKEYEVDVTYNTSADIDNNKSESENIIRPIESTEPKVITTTHQYEDVNGSEASVPTKTKSKGTKIFLSVIISIAVAIVAFFIYEETVIKSNQEKSKWNESVQKNTIAAYLDYMINFPEGKNYSIAEEAIMRLKQGETDNWQQLQVSENSSELKDFITNNPQSAYIPLIRKRLDSLSWSATLKDNTKESYKRYIDQSASGDFEGINLVRANDRLSMLTQSSPIVQYELDNIKQTVDGFFVALSSVNASNLEKYLAPRVYQFFNLGGGSREKIVGDLLISGSKTQTPTIKFIPDINGITYDKTTIENYKVNVAMQKSVTNTDGSIDSMYGFIVQMELNSDFQIITVSEIKPN